MSPRVLMVDPYAAPASESAEAQAAVHTAKPRRIWVFQALLAFQLAAGIAAAVSVLQMPMVQDLPPWVLLRGLLRTIVGTLLVVGLLLALQRVGPKPSLTAPILALLWWLLSLASHFIFGVPPESEAVKALKADDAPEMPKWLIAVVMHALLLWFVGSTWLNGRTRAYLAHPRRSKL